MPSGRFTEQNEMKGSAMNEIRHDEGGKSSQRDASIRSDRLCGVRVRHEWSATFVRKGCRGRREGMYVRQAIDRKLKVDGGGAWRVERMRRRKGGWKEK